MHGPHEEPCGRARSPRRWGEPGGRGSVSSSEPVSMTVERPPSRALRWGSLVLWLAMQVPLPAALESGGSAWSHLPSEGAFWLMAVVIVVWVVRVERRPPASIGLSRPTWRSVGWGAAAAVAIVAGLAVVYAVVLPALQADGQAPMGDLAQAPTWLSLLIVVRAAVFEELCYRGFAIERLGELLGSRRVAAGLSLAVFSLVHLYGWNWQHLVVVVYAGSVLTALYLWRRDLVACMIAHLLTDLTGVLLS